MKPQNQCGPFGLASLDFRCSSAISDRSLHRWDFIRSYSAAAPALVFGHFRARAIRSNSVVSWATRPSSKGHSGALLETPSPPPVVVTAADFRFIVTEQMQAIGIEPGSILIEPKPRNTAPAILAAALHLQIVDPGGLMLVAPSDHLIPDTDAFQAAGATAAEAASHGRIVTFGVVPDRPATGYGYLELSAPPLATVEDLVDFVEKPSAAVAESLVLGGRHLWNAGIFLASVSTWVEAFERHAPDLLGPVKQSVNEVRADLGFLRLAEDPWERVADVSVDYAVMEKSDNLSVVLLRTGWTDLGDWGAVGAIGEADSAGNVLGGAALAIDCEGSLIRSEDPDLQIVGVGLSNLVAVAMQDAVLIADRSRTQDVRSAVGALARKQVRQATSFPRDHRPWGWFETLSLGPRFQVKRIVVKPGGALSLQSHVHRAEHWVVVAGSAKVTVGEESKLLAENQSVYVPLGATHRLENPGRVELQLIEVQTGAYLGEDDIVRYEDIYERDAAE